MFKTSLLPYTLVQSKIKKFTQECTNWRVGRKEDKSIPSVKQAGHKHMPLKQTVLPAVSALVQQGGTGGRKLSSALKNISRPCASNDQWLRGRGADKNSTQTLVNLRGLWHPWQQTRKQWEFYLAHCLSKMESRPSTLKLKNATRR